MAVVRLTPMEKVKRAIEKGHNTREEIYRATRVPWDALTHCLAVLVLDREEVAVKKEGTESTFVVRAA